MRHKNYIGFILLIVFIGKLISIDAKFIEFATETNFVSHINPHCKKIKPPSTNTTTQFTILNSDINHTFQYVCATPYNLEISNWDNLFQPKYLQKIDYKISTIPSDYFNNQYPPPKV
ncbi:hypothetical protein [Gillisia sp. CAL575]|uniref:hypothetical protein n=1 Tax=Gillisia sp. CAL575 TaxID=985255 RepID=UPI0005559D5F|nr:hypothetical protein [Gillisia sp. CAL575]